MAKLIEDLFEASPNRRSFLKKIGAATAAVGAVSFAGATPAEAQSMTEINVLNFALNLEYLEAEFYTYAQYGRGITSFGLGIDGQANGVNPPSGGVTTGGAQVTYVDDQIFTRELASEIGTDERAHVSLLRTALGSAKIAKPNINLTALGFGFGNQYEYLTLARIFEDVGVSAYAGAAGLLTTPSIITTAARILAAEAEHVSSLRMQIAKVGLSTPQLDNADLLPPPSGSQITYLSINPSNGLPATRTPGQVLYLAFGQQAGVSKGGFFPTGVNGAITMSTAPADASNLD